MLQQLLKIWEQSVRATHHFLSSREIEQIKEYVPEALNLVPRLVIAREESGAPVGFMGVDGGRLEMLFLVPDKRGNGLGRLLVEYGMKHCGVKSVTVNEQNPEAKGFYEHMGFCVYKRTDCDEQGAPYPLLYMEISQR
ncbi:GNAT family N-acetyltransferase [Flavonifractor plautii]|uniref:GNAT family N-acetyltransferase n=1 Tax=Flavonifractor plautii TaxID=292800 RepID=UPI0012AB7E08